MTRAVDVALEKASALGLAAVTVRNAGHIGRLGSYVDRLARRDLAALLLVNAVGIPAFRMAPWGGTEARLATDPLAIGVPRSTGDPVVLDMTTTVVAEGKVRVQSNRGEPVPEGWLIDAEGRPTTDPEVLYEEPRGSILPLGGRAGGHKGYGLNVALELLAGALSGTGCIGGGQPIGNGVLLLALEVERFLPLDEFHREAERFFAHVKSSPPASRLRRDPAAGRDREPGAAAPAAGGRLRRRRDLAAGPAVGRKAGRRPARPGGESMIVDIHTHPPEAPRAAARGRAGAKSQVAARPARERDHHLEGLLRRPDAGRGVGGLRHRHEPRGARLPGGPGLVGGQHQRRRGRVRGRPPRPPHRLRRRPSLRPGLPRRAGALPRRPGHAGRQARRQLPELRAPRAARPGRLRLRPAPRPPRHASPGHVAGATRPHPLRPSPDRRRDRHALPRAAHDHGPPRPPLAGGDLRRRPQAPARVRRPVGHLLPARTRSGSRW